jgi:hypothetical protein
MLAKVWTVAVAAVIAGALVLPAPAAYGQASTAPAAKPMTMKKPMMKKASHKMDCYDYAWQSAAMSDCLAKGSSKASTGKSMMKKSAKKKMTS